jgi:hypothetical protein
MICSLWLDGGISVGGTAIDRSTVPPAELHVLGAELNCSESAGKDLKAVTPAGRAGGSPSW